MTPSAVRDARTSIVHSEDGTVIAYHSLGQGPGLVVVGGVLFEGSDYMPLANALSGAFEVHVLERRGRAGSGPMQPDHDLDDECADLAAVTAATGSAGSSATVSAASLCSRRPGDSPVSMTCSYTSPAFPSVAGSVRIGWTTINVASRSVTDEGLSPVWRRAPASHLGRWP